MSEQQLTPEQIIKADAASISMLKADLEAETKRADQAEAALAAAEQENERLRERLAAVDEWAQPEYIDNPYDAAQSQVRRILDGRSGLATPDQEPPEQDDETAMPEGGWPERQGRHGADMPMGGPLPE